MDGRADLSRVLTVKFRDGDLRIVSVEDMIADRVGQALAGPRIDSRMQEQAVSLYRLAASLDRAYLDKRIAQDSVNQASVTTLEAWDRAGH